MKKLKIGLLGKILIAIALGIGVGLIAQPWMVRTMLTFSRKCNFECNLERRERSVHR